MNNLKRYIDIKIKNELAKFQDKMEFSQELKNVSKVSHDILSILWKIRTIEKKLDHFEDDKRYFKTYSKDPYMLKKRDFVFDFDKDIMWSLDPQELIKRIKDAIMDLKRAKMDKQAKIVERELLNSSGAKKMFKECEKARNELKKMEDKVEEARLKENERILKGKPTNTKDIEMLFRQFSSDCEDLRRRINWFDDLAFAAEGWSPSVDDKRNNYTNYNYQKNVSRINELSKAAKYMKDFSRNLSKSNSPYGRKLKMLLKSNNLSEQDAINIVAKDNSHGIQYWLRDDFKWGIEEIPSIIQGLKRWVN